jgi:hypothetical protein
MDDLVKRLRGWPPSIAHNVMQDAADRIEALEARITKADARVAELEAVLQGMIGGKVYVAGHGFVETNESRAARAALKGQDDG